MLPPACLIGALYPLMVSLATNSAAAPPIRVLGLAAAMNTVGNIAGVLAAGFLMLPVLGSVAAIRALAMLALALGLVCLWQSRRAISATGWSVLAAVLIAWVVQPGALDYDALVSGANVYFQKQDWGPVVDHAESVDGGLTAVARRSQSGQEVLTLLTNGKFQGNNAPGGEIKAQAGFALAPLLHTSRRDRALVIGYGTGQSAYTLHAAGFAQLDNRRTQRRCPASCEPLFPRRSITA